MCGRRTTRWRLLCGFRRLGYDHNMTNMKLTPFSKEVIERAIRKLTQGDGRISVEPIADLLLLPPPKEAGQVVDHPASRKRYVAKEMDGGLVWERIS